MNDKKEVITEIQRQIKFVEQVGSNLRMLCHAMEKEENQPEPKQTETLVEMNDRDEVDTLVELSDEWLNQIVDCTCRLNSLNKRVSGVLPDTKF
jgi:predicted HTH transcriptional regulator